MNIPVFHDDQHGTAIIVLAGIINALKIVKKDPADCHVVVNGSGAAGIAISKLLLAYGFKHLLLCDSKGIVSSKSERLNWIKKEMLQVTNENDISGTLADALKGADIFIGVSAPGVVTQDMVRSMNRDAILFAMANPVPEIMPDLAKEAGARIVGTGRSDFPNQVNNVLVFPGLFRGALDYRATKITEGMQIAAARGLASLVDEKDLSPDHIIVSTLDKRVVPTVAKAVGEEAVREGVVRK